MTETAPGLTGVSETLMIPLAARVLEGRRDQPVFADPVAESVADKLGKPLEPYAAEWTNVETVIGRTTILDLQTRAFLEANPSASVVNVGAGLCTRFFRVDNGTVNWTDVDLAPVIDLKKGLVEESDRYRLVTASVTEDGWTDQLGPLSEPVLFIAEGLLIYLSEGDVVKLFESIARAYPGSHMLLEAMSPFLLKSMGRRSTTVKATGATFDWGLKDPEDLERLVPGTKVQGVWYHTEAHPDRWRWMKFLKYIRPIHTAMKIVHVQLPGAA